MSYRSRKSCKPPCKWSAGSGSRKGKCLYRKQGSGSRIKVKECGAPANTYRAARKGEAALFKKATKAIDRELEYAHNSKATCKAPCRWLEKTDEDPEQCVYRKKMGINEYYQKPCGSEYVFKDLIEEGKITIVDKDGKIISRPEPAEVKKVSKEDKKLGDEKQKFIKMLISFKQDPKLSGVEEVDVKGLIQELQKNMISGLNQVDNQEQLAVLMKNIAFDFQYYMLLPEAQTALSIESQNAAIDAAKAFVLKSKGTNRESIAYEVYEQVKQVVHEHARMYHRELVSISANVAKSILAATVPKIKNQEFARVLQNQLGNVFNAQFQVTLEKLEDAILNDLKEKFKAAHSPIAYVQKAIDVISNVAAKKKKQTNELMTGAAELYQDISNATAKGLDEVKVEQSTMQKLGQGVSYIANVGAGVVKFPIKMAAGLYNMAFNNANASAEEARKLEQKKVKLEQEQRDQQDAAAKLEAAKKAENEKKIEEARRKKQQEDDEALNKAFNALNSMSSASSAPPSSVIDILGLGNLYPSVPPASAPPASAPPASAPPASAPPASVRKPSAVLTIEDILAFAQGEDKSYVEDIRKVKGYYVDPANNPLGKAYKRTEVASIKDGLLGSKQCKEYYYDLTDDKVKSIDGKDLKEAGSVIYKRFRNECIERNDDRFLAHKKTLENEAKKEYMYPQDAETEVKKKGKSSLIKHKTYPAGYKPIDFDAEDKYLVEEAIDRLQPYRRTQKGTQFFPTYESGAAITKKAYECDEFYYDPVANSTRREYNGKVLTGVSLDLVNRGFLKKCIEKI